MRGLFQRKRYQRSKSRIIRLQCLYRVHRACKILKTLKSEAKDLGKLKQSNEQMKAEIELWRKKALEDSERVAAEMKAKAAEEQKIAMAEMTSELMNEKEVSSSLRTLLKEAEDKIELLEAKVSQLEVSLSAAESNAGSGAVAPPQPPVMSSPSSSQHKKSSSAGGVAVSISSGNDGAAHAKLQAEYDTLLSMHERESAIWSVKLAEMEELNAQMYQLSEANAKIDEENSELNDEIARLRSLLLDQGSLGKLDRFVVYLEYLLFCIDSMVY